MAVTQSSFNGIKVTGTSNTVLSGYTLATPFTCTLDIQDSSTQSAITSTYTLLWSFGDGTYDTSYSPSHIYNWPGVYEVKVALYNNATNQSVFTFSKTVTAWDYITDTLSWNYSNWPDLNSAPTAGTTNGPCFYGYQSCKSGTAVTGPLPIVFNYSTRSLETSALTFYLYSQNSLSQPYSEIPKNQAATLRPTWRFTTVSAMPLDNGYPITNYKPISSTEIRILSSGLLDPNGVLVGLSGIGSFYYIDDLPSLKITPQTLDGSVIPYQSVNPTTIWVTLDRTNVSNIPGTDYINVPSYSNSLVSLSSYYYVQSFTPDHIDITLNNKLPLNPTYWVGAENQFVTTLKSPLSSNNGAFLSNVTLFNYPLNKINNDIFAASLTTLILNDITNNSNVPITDHVGNHIQSYNKSTVNLKAGFNMSSTSPVTDGTLLFSFSRTDSLGRDTGGYYLGTFTPYASGTALFYIYDNNANGFAYVKDLTPNINSGYNPKLISYTPIAPLYYIDQNYTNTLGNKGMTSQSISAFNVIDFNSTYFTRKINGGFDFSNQLKTYALQPTINQNSVLFDNYLAAVAGTSATYDDTYGGVVYEKIANYVLNMADLNTANVNSFYSQAESLGLTLDNYNYDIPPTLGRVVDLYSTQQSVIWGARSLYARNFSLSAGLPNLGGILKEYNIATTMVSAGQKIVVNDLFNSQYYELIEVPVIKNYDSVTARKLNSYLPLVAYPESSYPLTNYPLSALFGWGLQTPVSQYYRFFVYNGTADNQQVEGLVNWDDELTALQYTDGANHADWIKDGGILENIYNYYIHKGLGLIK